MCIPWVREMSITHDEFLRLLPKALNGLDYCQHNDKFYIKDGDCRIRIHLSEQSTRELASLSLPVTVVSIEIDGYSKPESDQFIKRFALAYQKGGG